MTSTVGGFRPASSGGGGSGTAGLSLFGPSPAVSALPSAGTLTTASTSAAAGSGTGAPSPATAVCSMASGSSAEGSFAGGGGSKPVPMKLFATWEVDRTPPNCIPRLCTLTLTRLVLHKKLGMDLNSVLIAVKMQSSKRTLRSNEIELPPSGLLDTELDLAFSLQYPHFLKREGNQLHVMLQRRKKYKNRTILGFKTLAIGTINMSQVLQKQMDLELELFSDLKDKSSGAPIGKIFMLSLSSQPVDHEDSSGRTKGVQGEAGDRDLLFSDEDDDFSSAEEGSDSEPLPEEAQQQQQPHQGSQQQTQQQQQRRRGKTGRSATGGGASAGASSATSAAAVRQRNLKQKFVALLKKFKVTDPEELEQEQVSLDQKLSEGTVDPAEIEDLFDQLEDLSGDDSGPDVDTISVGSTPKPSLKPFFNSSKNLLAHQQQQQLELRRESGESSRIQQLQQKSSSSAIVGGIASELGQAADYSGGGAGGGGGGAGSDRLSDESSKDGWDSHPETLTDPEFSDPVYASSPPPSGDEGLKQKLQGGERRSRLKKSGGASGEYRLSLMQQQHKNAALTMGSSSLSATTTALAAASAANRPSQPAAAAVGGGNTSNLVMDSASPRKVLLEQLSRVLPSDGDSLVDQLVLANTCDRQGAHLAARLSSERPGCRLVCTAGPADVRAVLTCLVAKVQKFCNTQATQTPPMVRVGLIGSDTFVNSLLRPYVEVFSSKPPDWQGYLKFFVIPLGSNSVSKYIGRHDPLYSSTFLHESWRELVEKAEPTKADAAELAKRVFDYLNCPADRVLPLPVAEAMVTYKEKSSDEESSQVFVPFVSDVRVCSDSGSGSFIQSIDLDDDQQQTSSPTSALVAASAATPQQDASSPYLLIGPPPPSLATLAAATGSGGAAGAGTEKGSRTTPPSSPHVGKESAREFFSDPVELQLDYWVSSDNTTADAPSSFNPNSSGGLLGGRGGRGGGDRNIASGGEVGSELSSSVSFESASSKSSIKTSIRHMLVQRSGDDTFSMQYWVKEKKQKAVMRLGKRKEKDPDGGVKSQTVDGITRLICLSKAQTPVRVYVDGLEWQGVKFFQLSSQWQTHIKAFPIATFPPQHQSKSSSEAVATHTAI